jgi:hypothetical protein
MSRSASKDPLAYSPQVALRVLATIAAVILLLPAAARAATLHATPSTFASTVSSAQAGDTVLLASGSYGTWSGTNKAITIKNEDGATPSMKFSFDTGDSGFTLDGMTGMGGSFSNGANHITIQNSAFSSPTTIQGVSNGSILLDHDTFNNIDATNGGPPARIWLPGSTPHPSGVTLQNSKLIGGSTDGIQAGTALNVLNNEFANIVHGNSDNHTDNIQLFGGQAQDGVGSTIKGNYLHDGETGIVQFDGGGGHDVEDNVIARMSIFGMDFGGDRNSKVVHNTQFQSVGNGLDMTSKAGQSSIGTVIKDNVVKNIPTSGASPAANDHNMLISGASGQNFNGTPQFVGGSNPTTYAGFALASSSPGKARASDGSDVGARFVGGSQPPGDTTPPDTTISSGPSDPSSSDSASFSFASTESGSTYECKLDAGSYAGCTAPKSYSGLSSGAHTFSVRATDAAGNTDASPASWTWTISTTTSDHQPTAVYSYAPSAPSAGQAVSFDASASACDDAPCTYTWVDDGTDGPGGTDWPLGSGKTMSFTFQNPGTKNVRATVTDNDGDSATTVKAITVGSAPPADTTPPDTTIASGPSNPTSSTSASFAFTSSEAGSTYQCKLDAGAYGACTSPRSYSGLSAGSHTFSVRATDAAGNTDASPATQTWTIQAADHQPTAVYSYAPTAPKRGQAVSFDASASACDDAPCTYTWVDDGPDGPGGDDWSLGSGKTMSFTFKNAGTKHVRLTVTDADGDSATVVKDIKVT